MQGRMREREGTGERGRKRYCSNENLQPPAVFLRDSVPAMRKARE